MKIREKQTSTRTDEPPVIINKFALIINAEAMKWCKHKLYMSEIFLKLSSQ